MAAGGRVSGGAVGRIISFGGDSVAVWRIAAGVTAADSGSACGFSAIK